MKKSVKKEKTGYYPRQSGKENTVLKKIKKEFLIETEILKNGNIDDAKPYLDFADVLLIVIDRNQRVVKINKKGCEIFGYPENRIIGKNYFDNFIPERFRKEMKAFFNDIISGEKILSRYFENPIITKKGERLISWRNIVLKDSDGTIIGTLSEGRDITEQRQKENQLVEKEKRARLLFENAPACYVSCSAEGRIQDVNSFFIKTTGFEKERIIGRNFKSIVFPQDRKVFDRFLAEFEKIDFAVSEFRIRRKDGSVLDVYCTAKISGGEYRLIQLIFYDVSHRRFLDISNDTQKEINSIINKANDVNQIITGVPSVLKKMLGFIDVSIYLQDTADKKAKKIIKLAESGSFTTEGKMNGKEIFYAGIMLKIEDRPEGVLYCSGRKNRFNPETIRFLENIAGTISAGIQRCRYYELLKSNVENFNTFLNSTDEMVFIKDSNFRYIFINDTYAGFFKKKSEEILGKTDFDLMEPDPAKRCRQTDLQALKENKIAVNEGVVGGRTCQTRKFPVKLESGEIGVGAFIRDITEEKENSQKVQNLMWMYSMLYQVNQVIVRAKNIDELFAEICEIAQKEGKFTLAWIGKIDYEKKVVIPVAGSKSKRQYFENIKISLLPEKPESKGPTGRAAITGRCCVCQNIPEDSRMLPWRDKAKKFGFCSSAAVPVKAGGETVAVLNLYSDQPYFFTGEMVQLVNEVASDIGFCMEKLNAEEIRKKAEQNLRENELHLRGIFENIPIPAAEMDFSEAKKFVDSLRKHQGNIESYLAEKKDVLNNLMGCVRFLNINKKMFEFFNTDETDKLIDVLIKNLITPEIIKTLYVNQAVENFETSIKIGDDTKKEVILNLNILPGYERNWSRAIITVFDITDRYYMEKNIHSLLSRFRGFFNTDLAGMGILDLEGRPIALNRRICNILGYSHEELMQMKLVDVVHPDERTSMQVTYEKLKRKEITHYEMERRYVRKDGTVVWCYVSAEMVFDDILGKNCITAAAIDITEQKKHLQQLERIQSILRSYAAGCDILARAEEEKPMLFSICKELSEKAKLGFSVVFLRNEKGFEIAAYSEEKFEFFSEIREMIFNRGIFYPTTDVMNSNRRVIVNDIENSDYSEQWKQTLLRHGFKSIFVQPIIVEGNSIGVISIFSSEKNRFSDEKENTIISGIGESIGHCITLLRARKEMAVAAAELEKSYEQLQETIKGISFSITKIIETRDPYTAGHQQRVAKLAVSIARELGLPENQIHGIYFAGILHDIGKVNVPIEILVKPTRLTEDEFNIIKLHSVYGYEILKNIPFQWNVGMFILQHHERLNGSGYPDGLKENEILQEAKIIAVADVVEAMAYDRPYRAALGIDEALREIESKKGILFDPASVDTCIKLFKEKGFVFD